MPDTFGARMREQRERQQVTLSTIAEQTKIKVALLEALERDDVSHWPSGIFRRAFIRAYAHAIGLEPDSVLREFLELYPDQAEVFAAALAANVDDGRATNGRPQRIKYLVASAIESVSRLRTRTNYKVEPALEAPVAIAEIDSREDLAPVPLNQVLSKEPAVDAAPPPVIEEQVQPEPQPAASLQPDSAPPIAFAAEAEPVVPQPTATVAPVTPPDLMPLAYLCTDLACVQTTADVPPLLDEMTELLGAVGVIVWLWDPIADELRPALACGYSDHIVAQLPRVGRDTNNATAAAFRASRMCVVRGNDIDNGAFAVPLMAPGKCVGVLAIELADRREEQELVRAQAMIVAAQLATLIGTAQTAEASDRRLA